MQQVFNLVISLLSFLYVNANEDAKRLYDDLMVNYNRHRRPASGPHEPLTIKLKLRLSQIIDVVSSMLITFTHYYRNDA
ncbi:hypothetical protein COOONC_01957 [Cooperia oncophora]